MPFHISYHLSDGKWLFGTLACHFFLTLDILLCTSSILHLCCIALDRYWAIKDSIKYAQKRTMKRVLLMILIVWLSSAVISLPVIIWNLKSVRSVTSKTNNNYQTQHFISNSTIQSTSSHMNKPINLDQKLITSEQTNIVCDIPRDKLYRFYSSSGTFYVPLLIMTFVYVRIYMETKRRLHERAKAAKKLAKSMANSSAFDRHSIKNISCNSDDITLNNANKIKNNRKSNFKTKFKYNICNCCCCSSSSSSSENNSNKNKIKNKTNTQGARKSIKKAQTSPRQTRKTNQADSQDDGGSLNRSNIESEESIPLEKQKFLVESTNLESKKTKILKQNKKIKIFALNSTKKIVNVLKRMNKQIVQQTERIKNQLEQIQ